MKDEKAKRLLKLDEESIGIFSSIQSMGVCFFVFCIMITVLCVWGASKFCINESNQFNPSSYKIGKAQYVIHKLDVC